MIAFRMINKSITLNFDQLQTSHISVFVLVHQPVAAVPGTGVCVFKRRLWRKVESGCSGGWKPLIREEGTFSGLETGASMATIMAGESPSRRKKIE